MEESHGIQWSGAAFLDTIVFTCLIAMVVAVVVNVAKTEAADGLNSVADSIIQERMKPSQEGSKDTRGAFDRGPKAEKKVQFSSEGHYYPAGGAAKDFVLNDSFAI